MRSLYLSEPSPPPLQHKISNTVCNYECITSFWPPNIRYYQSGIYYPQETERKHWKRQSHSPGSYNQGFPLGLWASGPQSSRLPHPNPSPPRNCHEQQRRSHMVKSFVIYKMLIKRKCEIFGWSLSHCLGDRKPYVFKK